MNSTFLWQIKTTEVKNYACHFVEQCQKRMFLTSLKFVVSEVLDYLSLWKSARWEALQSHLLILQQDDITENLEHQRWGKIKSSRKLGKT